MELAESGGEAAGGGELGGGEQEAGHDGSEGELAGTGGPPVEEARQAELLAEAQDGGDVAMGEGAADGDGILEAGEHHAALEEGTDAGHDMGREIRDIGEGLAANALAFAPGLADQDGGGTVAVWDFLDVDGHEICMETEGILKKICMAVNGVCTWKQISRSRSPQWDM